MRHATRPLPSTPGRKLGTVFAWVAAAFFAAALIGILYVIAFTVSHPG